MLGFAQVINLMSQCKHDKSIAASETDAEVSGLDAEALDTEEEALKKEADEHKANVKAQTDLVKVACGTACFGALAAHFRTESAKRLEWRIDGRHLYEIGAERAPTNIYLKWRQGALPNEKSLASIENLTNKSVALSFWRYLPLWELLELETPPINRLHRLLEERSRNIRQILFHGDLHPDVCPHHVIPNRSQILGIRNLHSLDAFLTLICLARKGEALEDDPLHFLSAASAFDILPRVLYTHRSLRFEWEKLFASLDDVLWRRVYASGFTFSFPIDVTRQSLAVLDADPNASLPSMSGLRIRA